MEKRSEKGIISIFVIFSMIFLLIFVITSYFLVKEKIKIRESENSEIKRIYSESVSRLRRK